MWRKTAVEVPPRDGRPGGWHYAQVWDTGGHPIGYCDLHAPHQTEAEARECYGRWLRDNVRLDERFADRAGCRVCDAPTKAAARIGIRSEPLCAEHLTAEHAYDVLGLRGPAGDSFGS